MTLPDGLLVGHWTDPVGLTGCTVVLAPEGADAGGEVRGGGPGTRETDLLLPSSGARRVHGVLFTGGSAFGLAAADGVVRWLTERGHGHETALGVRVPLVPAAVVFDLGRGDAHARPGPDAGYAACEAARGGPGVVPQRGAVGAGTGTSAGKITPVREDWAPTGLGWAAADMLGATVGALAVVNPVGEVVDEDGTVLAGAPLRTVEALRAGSQPPPAREATTLVCVVTDAPLDRTEAWLVARAASAGVARAVRPSATVFDGDVAICLSTGRGPRVEPFAISALAADVVAEAIRDGARLR
jgi:L-aminopeptidase/D-esterase-like protein